MVSREEKKLLKDNQDAILSIDEHLEERRIFSEYLNNKTKRRAVERELEIIGEAAGNLLKINPDIFLSYARLIVDLRNRVIYAYDAIDNEIIWKIIMKDIPILQDEINSLINE